MQSRTMSARPPPSFRDAPLGAGPEIHLTAYSIAKWIPGSTLTRRPGMTKVGVTRSVCHANRFARHRVRVMRLAKELSGRTE